MIRSQNGVITTYKVIPGIPSKNIWSKRFESTTKRCKMMIRCTQHYAPSIKGIPKRWKNITSIYSNWLTACNIRLMIDS
jgi:hypothetical protein